ncbi:MAG TPA: DUF4011 domain-containing protein, partial [Geopsychrobacteraceae bacterium]
MNDYPVESVLGNGSIDTPPAEDTEVALNDTAGSDFEEMGIEGVLDESDASRSDYPEGDLESPPVNAGQTNNEDQIHKGFAFDSLEAVRKKLIDLTNRNNLLNYRHPKTSCLRIIDELPDQIVEVLGAGKS